MIDFVLEEKYSRSVSFWQILQELKKILKCYAFHCTGEFAKSNELNNSFAWLS